MKTIILYASKNGATREIAERLQKALAPETADVVDLKSSPAPSLEGYDCVALGGSIYAGSLRKEAKRYAANNVEALKAKRLGLFVSCMAGDGGEKFIAENFPPELVAAAKAKASPGGMFDPARASGFDRFIINMVTKKTDYFNSISDEKIAAFARELKG